SLSPLPFENGLSFGEHGGGHVVVESEGPDVLDQVDLARRVQAEQLDAPVDAPADALEKQRVFVALTLPDRHSRRLAAKLRDRLLGARLFAPPPGVPVFGL